MKPKIKKLSPTRIAHAQYTILHTSNNIFTGRAPTTSPIGQQHRWP